jgi:hypothetical protein
MTADRARRSIGSRFRLWALLVLLLGTLLWAWHDVRTRRARTEWQRPVEVSVALVQLGQVDQPSLIALRQSFPALETRLAAEYRRFGGPLTRPIAFTIFGPVSVDRPPPVDPDGSITSLARHAYDQWRWTRAVDRGSELETAGFDSRIYVVVRAPSDSARSWVEGSSEQGGRVGIARIELEPSSVGLALFVVTHEFFHTLGATDKYDEQGRALIPAGLVEPDRVPLYPQRFAEVMTRNVVVAPGRERPPESLAELGVGDETAREIGWLSSSP